MTVTVSLPTMLAGLIGDQRTVTVAAGETVGDALASLFARYPVLRVHLIDEGGGLRRHVLCFCNGRQVDRLDEPAVDGDSVTVLQAVSGG